MTFLFKFRTRNSEFKMSEISICQFQFQSLLFSSLSVSFVPSPSHSIFLSTCLPSSYFLPRSFCSTLGIARAKYEKERGLFFVFLPGALPIDSFGEKTTGVVFFRADIPLDCFADVLVWNSKYIEILKYMHAY